MRAGIYGRSREPLNAKLAAFQNVYRAQTQNMYGAGSGRGFESFGRVVGLREGDVQIFAGAKI